MRRLEREGRALARWQSAHVERMKSTGVELEQRAAWSRSTWIKVRACRTDGSRKGLRHYLQLARHRFPAAVSAIVAAALGPTGEGCARTWRSERAANIAALALALLWESQPTRRKGRWGRMLSGHTVQSMLHLLADPYDSETRLHPNTLIGRAFVGASLERGGLGYLRALEAAGFLYCQQLPAAQVAPSEVFRFVRANGAGELETVEYTSNRYWICTAVVDDGHLSDRVRARVRELAALLEFIGARKVEVRPRRRIERLAPLDPSPSPD